LLGFGHRRVAAFLSLLLLLLLLLAVGALVSACISACLAGRAGIAVGSRLTLASTAVARRFGIKCALQPLYQLSF
jgi:hypothetical protein